MSEVNTTQLIENLLDQGAVLLGGLQRADEAVAIDPHWEDADRFIEKVPKLGALVTGIAAHMEDPIISVHSLDILPSKSFDVDELLHLDDQGRYGISLLVPIAGPDADFWYSATPGQCYPDELDLCGYFTYGLGDVAVLRQEFNLQRGESQTVRNYSRMFHLGRAAALRTLMTIDIIPQAPDRLVHY